MKYWRGSIKLYDSNITMITSPVNVLERHWMIFLQPQFLPSVRWRHLIVGKTLTAPPTQLKSKSTRLAATMAPHSQLSKSSCHCLYAFRFHVEWNLFREITSRQSTVGFCTGCHSSQYGSGGSFYDASCTMILEGYSSGGKSGNP